MPAFSNYDMWKLRSPDDDRSASEFEPELEEMTEPDWLEKQELEMSEDHEAMVRRLSDTPAVFEKMHHYRNGGCEVSTVVRVVLEELRRAERSQPTTGPTSSSEAALRKALEFYANPEIYKPHPHGPAFDRRDLSATAKAALSAFAETKATQP